MIVNNEMKTAEDKSILTALKKGDIIAFDEIYYKYHKKLFAYSMKFIKSHADIEDLIQKIFVIIWEKRENIDPDKSFNNYLFTIIRNEIYDFLKKKVMTEYYNDQILSEIEETDDDIETKKLVEIIYTLIEKMPERRRQIFKMNRDLGMTYRQIAKELGISENTVDTQIRNSLNYLRAELPKQINSSTLLLISLLIIITLI